MPSSPSAPGLRPAAGTPRPLWSVALGARPRGLSLAREKGWLLAWDEAGWLTLLDRKGARQAQRHEDGGVAVACSADDGSAYVSVSGSGVVRWLAPDLMPRWQHTLPAAPLAAALDPFGRLLAVSDTRGNLHLFDHAGRRVAQAQTARPLYHLALVPEAPLLIGCADFGLVAAFDLTGKQLWRDGLVAIVGALAVSGDGGRIVLACFSDGLRPYTLTGQKGSPVTLTEPCRLVALSYTGDRALAAGMDRQLTLLDRGGRVLASFSQDAIVTALALAPLGATAAVALADKRVVSLDLLPQKSG